MEDMSEEIKIGLEDKAGNMRLQSLRFLGWGVGRKEKDGRMMNMVKMFLDRLVKLNEDSS